MIFFHIMMNDIFLKKSKMIFFHQNVRIYINIINAYINYICFTNIKDMRMLNLDLIIKGVWCYENVCRRCLY